MTSRTVFRTVGVWLLTALAVTGWVLFGPAQLGGGTRYAIVEGTSMWPVLSGGDLAVVRADGDYRPGDVVLYREADLHVDVLHRIARIDRGRVVLKGDNNDFYDDARLKPSDIKGSLWFSVPHVGLAVMWI
jgi:signal peptidase